MADWKTHGKILKSGNIRSPIGRLIYPQLFEPKAIGDGKPRYSVNLVFPEDKVDLTIIRKAVDEALVNKFGDKILGNKKLKLPIFDADGEFPKLDFDFDGWVGIRLGASEKDRPVIIDASLADVEDESQVYGGRWATASFNVFAWDHPAGGKGASLGLSNVQVLKHDDNIGPGRVDASKEFEEMEPEDDDAEDTGSLEDMYG